MRIPVPTVPRIAVVAVTLLLMGCEAGRDPSVTEANGGVVRLVIVPDEPASGTIPDYVLVNDTEKTVAYGRPFTLEKRISGEWTAVKNRCLFTLEGLSLEPAERSSPTPVAGCPTGTPGLEAGVYRVTTQVDVGEGDARDARTLVATFEVD